MSDSTLPDHLEPRPGFHDNSRVIPAHDRLRGLDVGVKLAAGFRQVEALEREWQLLHALSGGPHFKLPVEFRRAGADRALMTSCWLPGHSLLEPGGLRSPDKLLATVLSALDGLDRLHRSGWVHGDVRPQNLLVDAAGGQVRVSWLDLEFAQPFQKLEAGFEVVHGWDGGSGQSGGSRSPRTDLQALGETLASVMQTLPGTDSAASTCLRILLAQLQDPYRLLEIRDAAEAGLRLREVAADHGVTVPLPSVDPGPGMVVPNRAAWKQWELIQQRWLADGHTRCLQVAGPDGCGKTTFLRGALARLAPAGHVTLDLTPPGPADGEQGTLPGSMNYDLLDTYLAASVGPPAVLMNRDSWTRLGADRLARAPSGTLFVVEAAGDLHASGHVDGCAHEPWEYPGFSAREWMRWIAASI